LEKLESGSLGIFSYYFDFMNTSRLLYRGFFAVIALACAVIFPFLSQTPAADKCEVCHNDKNPHTVTIPCNQVDKYLSNHPGDYAGPCQTMTAEKPAKKKKS
jgi:hypothetical protein